MILNNYNWPGNVRELEHVIEGAIVLSQGDTIEARDLWMNPSLSAQNPLGPVKTATPVDGSVLSLEEVERLHIEKALNQNRWNRIRTAQQLGITPKTLYLKIKKFGIKGEEP
jgi:DNA-binding NtrC family response regulator